jgi:hypothetical protein
MWAFNDLVLTRRGFGVQDPRDMVFAHVNLAGLYKHPTADTRVQKLFSADYTKTCAHVYQDITKFLLTERPAPVYNLLAGAESMIRLEDRKLGLATWATDWSESSSTSPREFLWVTIERAVDPAKPASSSLLDHGSALLFYGYKRGGLLYVSSVLASEERNLIEDLIIVSGSINLPQQAFQSSLEVLLDYCSQILSGIKSTAGEYVGSPTREARLETPCPRLFTRLLLARAYGNNRYEDLSSGDDLACYLMEPGHLYPLLLSKVTMFAVSTKSTRCPSYSEKLKYQALSMPKYPDYNGLVPWLSEKNYNGKQMGLEDSSHFHFIGECFVDGWKFQDMMHLLSDNDEESQSSQQHDAEQEIMERVKREAFVLH